MKKFLALLLALTLALSLAVPAYAADPTEEDALDWAALEAELAKAEAEQRAAALKELGAAAGQINVLLNDKCVASPDAVPVLKDGRTMVPMRSAVEAMGAVVDYDAATRTASVKMGDVSFTHVIGTDAITLSDGSTVKMDVVSYIDKGRTMVPLRFFSQVLGYDVFWDNDYKLAFLMDEDTWAAAVDKDLSILNSLFAQQSNYTKSGTSPTARTSRRCDQRITPSSLTSTMPFRKATTITRPQTASTRGKCCGICCWGSIPCAAARIPGFSTGIPISRTPNSLFSVSRGWITWLKICGTRCCSACCPICRISF